jgi:hypothetical protein
MPSKAVPVVDVTVNGTSHSVQDTLQTLNQHGVDGAGCKVPSATSGTRSNEGMAWQSL